MKNFILIIEDKKFILKSTLHLSIDLPPLRPFVITPDKTRELAKALEVMLHTKSVLDFEFEDTVHREHVISYWNLEYWFDKKLLDKCVFKDIHKFLTKGLCRL